MLTRDRVWQYRQAPNSALCIAYLNMSQAFLGAVQLQLSTWLLATANASVERFQYGYCENTLLTSSAFNT